jgi:hypothetical protein
VIDGTIPLLDLIDRGEHPVPGFPSRPQLVGMWKAEPSLLAAVTEFCGQTELVLYYFGLTVLEGPQLAATTTPG